MFAFQNNTTYVYDFLELFQAAIKRSWELYVKGRSNLKVSIPQKLLISKELVFNETTKQLEETTRAPGENTVGMVAWKLTLFTPEFPEGRNIILIGNDITFEIGSFGVKEDMLFYKASELARKEGIPRLYLAANSGARIGLANEVRDQYHIEWIDENNLPKDTNFCI